MKYLRRLMMRVLIASASWVLAWRIVGLIWIISHHVERHLQQTRYQSSMGVVPDIQLHSTSVMNQV